MFYFFYMKDLVEILQTFFVKEYGLRRVVARSYMKNVGVFSFDKSSYTFLWAVMNSIFI